MQTRSTRTATGQRSGQYDALDDDRAMVADLGHDHDQKTFCYSLSMDSDLDIVLGTAVASLS